MAPFRDRLRQVRPPRPFRGAALTRLGDRFALATLRGPRPRVSEVRPGTWLVHAGRRLSHLHQLDRNTWVLQLPGKRRRVVTPLGPPALRAHLVIDEESLTANAQGARLQLLRHVALDHVAWLLDRLGVNVVLDVGANRGQFARELRARGYRGRIVSFEPVPRIARVLERRAADDPDWQVRRCALGDVDETLEIHEGAKQGRLSSLLPATDFGRSWSEGIDAHRTVEVPVRRLDGMFDELVEGVAEPRVYLKLDTQGYDVRAFTGAGDRVRDLVAMQSEVSMLPLYEGMPHYTDQLTTYEAAGFELAGMYPVIVDRPTMRVVEFDALLVRSPTNRH